MKQYTLAEDGFQIIHSEELRRLLQNMPHDLEGLAFHVPPRDVFRTPDGSIKQIQNLHQYCKDLVEPINALLASVFGITDYTILNNQYFCKPPGYKMTAPHQDNAYFNSKENIVTSWVPLHKVTVNNSCMHYLPKSHVNGILEHEPIGTNHRVRTGKAGVSMYYSKIPLESYVAVEMEPGDILVHDKDCLHYSSPNNSMEYRLAFTSIMKF